MASLSPHTGPLTQKQAAHLLRRTTFGPTRPEIDSFTGQTPAAALAQLFASQPLPAVPNWITNPPIGEDGRPDEFKVIHYWRAWTVDRMIHSGPSIHEKLTFFLHTHFTTIASSVERGRALFYQQQLFRRYGLGTFLTGGTRPSLKELAKKLCYDNAMLVVLDGRLNVKGSPNENFARELLELYTIGKGPEVGVGDYTTFTEQDVQQAARVLSGFVNDDQYGFSTDPKNPSDPLDPETGLATGVYRPWAHDAGNKTFSARFGNQTIAPPPGEVTDGMASRLGALAEVDALVEMIFAQPATAQHLCRKLYRFFVHYHLDESDANGVPLSTEIEQQIIVPLAATMVANNFELRPVLEQLLSSQHFYDLDNVDTDGDGKADLAMGAIIKSPLELTIGLIRFFAVNVPRDEAAYDNELGRILGYLSSQGLELFDPLDVSGYDAYHQVGVWNRAWITANNLPERYNTVRRLIAGDNGLGIDIINFVRNSQYISNPANGPQMVDEFISYLFPHSGGPTGVRQERRDYFVTGVLLDNLSAMSWQMAWNASVASNDYDGVRSQLNKFLDALLQSPEYQLM